MNILILRLSSLGDIVLTEPIARALRRAYPEARIDYVTKASYKGLVNLFQAVDNVYTEEEISKLREYDYLIDLHAKPKTFFLRRKLRAGKILVYKKKHLLRRAIVLKLTKKSVKSTVELYFSALQKSKLESEYISNPSIEAKKTDLNFVLSIFQKYSLPENSKKIILFPGAKHVTKQYPLEKYAEFLNSIDESWSIILAGSKQEYPLAVKLASYLKINSYNLCGEFDLPQLAAFINLGDIIVSNDSGPMHLAAALEKKQIAIFGATHPKLGFAPHNDNAIVLSANIRCQPCSLHGGEKCPKKHFACMKTIYHSALLEAFKQLNAD